MKNISHYMTREVECVSKDMCLKNVLKTFKSKNVSHLIVTNTNEEPIGMLSINDINKNLLSILRETTGKYYTELELNGTEAEDYMSKNLVLVQEADSVELAAEIFLQGKFHALPVVKRNKLTGIITNTDLLKAYYEKANNIQELSLTKS